MTHIDLFSGLAGFSIACQWNGIETEVFCEKDERCRRFLQRTYPGVPVWDDIRTFDGTKWRGRFLLTAGVPCQPASRAGKQRGKADDRWLWPEALRVVSEARPDWCLFENPLGINDVGLDGILADLESLDYEVAPPIILPACAVNSPQLRNRYWIVCHSGDGESIRPEHSRSEESECGKLAMSTQGASQGDMAHDEQQGRGQVPTEHQEGWGTSEFKRIGGKQEGSYPEPTGTDVSFWSNSIWLPCADGKVRRAPDDAFGLVDGLHRSVLAALGNSICWQVAAEIIKAIKKASV